MTQHRIFGALRSAIVAVGTGLIFGLTAPVSAQEAQPVFTTGHESVYPGKIEAMYKADVSTVIDSIVTKIHFRPGQSVNVGDPLFTLDNTDFELRVQTAIANVKRTGALLNTARRDMERAAQLRERGSISDVQLLKSEGALALAEAVHDQTMAGLRAARIDLERTVIYAPISGVIGKSLVDIGTYAQTGSKKRLAQIVQLDPVLLSYEFPYVTQLQDLNLHHTFMPDGLLSMLQLQIIVSDTWIYPHLAMPQNSSADLNPANGTMTVWAEVPNPDRMLRPGMSVTVRVKTDQDALNRLASKR